MSGGPRAGRWAFVSVADAGDPAVLAWIDGAEWNGWAVPWLPDESMAALEDAFFDDDSDESPPWRDVSGLWCIDADGETVRLERHLATVRGEVPLRLPLTDTGRMAWCWREVDRGPDAVRKAIEALESATAAPPRRRKGAAR